jgi:hypothetical protein
MNHTRSRESADETQGARISSNFSLIVPADSAVPKCFFWAASLLHACMLMQVPSCIAA